MCVVLTTSACALLSSGSFLDGHQNVYHFLAVEHHGVNEGELKAGGRCDKGSHVYSNKRNICILFCASSIT